MKVLLGRPIPANSNRPAAKGMIRRVTFDFAMHGRYNRGHTEVLSEGFRMPRPANQKLILFVFLLVVVARAFVRVRPLFRASASVNAPVWFK